MTSPGLAAQATMEAAVADAQQKGWQLEDRGPGWARLGKRDVLAHGVLALLSVVTLGLGLVLWVAVASRGLLWVRMVIAADPDGRTSVMYLGGQGLSAVFRRPIDNS